MVEKPFYWQEDLSEDKWDSILTSMNGHPLQSAKWGNARKINDGIDDHRWAAYKNGKPVYLVRFEERKILKLLKVAWIPKGPTISDQNLESTLQKEFFKNLRQKGFFICVTSPWRKKNDKEKNKLADHTIWIDLTIGEENLWKNLDKQFRYDVRRAKKEGVVVEKVNKQEDIHSFYELCKILSINKGFKLNISKERMLYLLGENNTIATSAHLFVARYAEKVCAGALIIRCGDNIHYMWGAVDRNYPKQRVGEAVQWGVIEWALSQNCKLYDLEGVNLQSNDGVYNFKKKLGGNIISLPGEQIYPLNNSIKFIASFFSIKQKSQLFLKNIFSRECKKAVK